MNPTGRSWIFFEVVMSATNMIKKSKAVVRTVFCMNLTIPKTGYLFQILMSVNMHTSFVMNPKNHRRRCLMREEYVCTASVLQNAEVHI